MTNKEFSNECKKRGFIKHGKSYMRVVGDGVFQHIFCGLKERLDSSSPRYSQTHRYEPTILIFLKSMYALYNGFYISIDSTRGLRLTVSELLDKKDSVFVGSDPELERMMNEGFDVLDTITTQQQIIEYLDPVATFYRCGQRYSTQLFYTYLYCEEFHKAQLSIEIEFAANYFALMGNCRVDPEVFSEKKCRFIENDQEYYERYLLTFPVHYDAMKDKLRKNYEINSCRLRELGIPLE